MSDPPAAHRTDHFIHELEQANRDGLLVRTLRAWKSSTELSELEPLLRRLIAELRASPQADGPSGAKRRLLAAMLGHLGAASIGSRVSEALELTREAIDVLAANHGDDDRLLVALLVVKARCLSLLGRTREAVEILREAMQSMQLSREDPARRWLETELQARLDDLA